jgi:hypothetical protein
MRSKDKVACLPSHYKGNDRDDARLKRKGLEGKPANPEWQGMRRQFDDDPFRREEAGEKRFHIPLPAPVF